MQGAAPGEAQGGEEAAGKLGQQAMTEVPALPAEEVAASIGAAVSGDPVCEAFLAAQELSQLVMPGSGERFPWVICNFTRQANICRCSQWMHRSQLKRIALSCQLPKSRPCGPDGCQDVAVH